MYIGLWILIRKQIPSTFVEALYISIIHPLGDCNSVESFFFPFLQNLSFIFSNQQEYMSSVTNVDMECGIG